MAEGVLNAEGVVQAEGVALLEGKLEPEDAAGVETV